MRSATILPALGCWCGLTAAAVAQPLTIVSNEPGSFIDISATGTVLVLNDDDEAVINPGLGNEVFPAGSIVVGNNGGIAFPSVPGQNDLAPLNAPIPSASAFSGRQSLLAYWDDIKGDDFASLERGGKNGSVLWLVIPVPGGFLLIIQWEYRIIESGLNRATQAVRFQIQIFYPTAPTLQEIFAQIVYVEIEPLVRTGGGSATIGYQNGGSDSNDVQWSFNTPGAVSNGTVLSLVRANSIPAVSDAGNVALVLLFLTAGVFVFRRGRWIARAS